MSLPPKEEIGIKLFAWHTNELATDVPIKKRRFLFKRSPSPPPHSTTLTAENCDQQPKGTDSPAAESSVSEVSDQVFDSGFTNIRDSSLECRVENAADKEANLLRNCESSPSFSGRLLLTLSTTAAAAAAGCGGAGGIGDGEKLVSEKRSPYGLILGKNSEVTDFRSTLGDGNFGNKLISSDKSAFQRVLANTELPLPLNRQSSDEPVVLGTSAKEGQFSSCKLELTLPESQFSSLSKQTNSQLGLSHDDQHSNRSHWDLNTTMDDWESSVVDTTLKHRGCGNDKDLEMDPVEKSQHESTGPQIASGSYALFESACSLKLASTLLKPLGENCGPNTDLNLQLNTNFGSMSLSNLGVPFAPNIPSTHKISNYSFPARPITVTQSTNLTVCDTVKTEPVEHEGGNGKNIGACNFKSVGKSIIKSEALDTVEQEVLKTVCLSDVSTSCGSVVKSEQLEVPCVEGPRAAEGKAQYHGISSNAHGTVSTWEMHRDAKDGVALSLDLVSQGLFVDCNKVHDIPEATNIVPSEVLGESPCKAMPVFAADPPVLNEPKLDLGEDMPSNANQAHGASPNIGSPTKVIPRSIISCNDSQNFYLAPTCVVTRDSEESVIMASELLSESHAMVGNELSQVKGASEAVDSTSLLDSESKEQTVADYKPGNGEHMPYSDGAAQLCGSAPVDVCTSHTSFDIKVSETDEGGEVRKTGSCKTGNEACGSHEAAGAKEIASKLHGDDDDYEDGELRESLLRDAIKGSRNTKEKKSVNIKDGVKSDVPVIIASVVSGNENKLRNTESKDVHCAMEFESRLGTEKNDAGLTVLEDEKESPVIGMSVIDSGKKKAVKVSDKMPEESGKDNSETKTTCEKILRCSPEKGPDNTGDDLGSQLTNATADLSGPAKVDASRTYNVSDHIRSRSDRSNAVRLRSSSKASSGRIKSSRGRSSSRSERERVKDEAFKLEKVHMKSSRDESCIHQMRKSKKERDQDQTLRMAGSDFMHIRGRNQQSDILHGACYPDRGYASEHFNMSTSSQLSRSKNASEVAFAVGMDGMFESAGRTGKRHMDDELCRPPPRRPSPGGRGPPSVGVQMINRTMRDVSPGRCIEGGIPEFVMLNHEGKLMRGFADDMVNSSLFLRSRSNYEPVENCLIRRERSLSPFQRRAAPHAPHIPFASLTRPRVRSPHLWSPRRSPDGFDGRPDLIRCRSPDLRVERVRSPGERPCFQENMLGGRHISPHMPQLHGEMADVNLMRGHDLRKPGRHPRGNLRRFEVIDDRVNSDNLGRLQSGQFRGLEGDDVYVEERRNSDEGQGLARPFRQHYMVEDGVGNDGSFHRCVEDFSPPRPIRFCQDMDGEFPRRNISRGSGIRNRLGNMHRKVRGVDEPEDNYRHDNGQGWHGDVRLKRRRF